MHAVVFGCVVLLLVSQAWADSPEPPLGENRLTVSTLVREDIFSGWQDDDMERYARAERNIEQLLKDRPVERAELLAWKGGTRLYRAVLALEAGKKDEFDRGYQETLDLFKEARELAPKGQPVAMVTVAAVVGGSYALFADRLPEKYRPAAWAVSYEQYQLLWKFQADALQHLPVHIRGELLAGLAQSAERTGRKEQRDEYLEKIVALLPGTGYEKVAKEWKADPAAAAKGNISCKTCHNAGRLENKLAQLKDK